MNKFTKSIIAVVILFSITNQALADRGIGRKSKNKATLNIAPANIRNYISLNLNAGLSYKGSFLNTRKIVGNSIINNSISTFQKGNTTYILPYKNKITVAEISQGYTGVKIIIKRK